MSEPARRPGGLAALGSIKVKLGLLVAASALVAAAVATVGRASGVSPWLALPVTIALALGVTQLLATGMTSPLRQMTDAARRMAAGDYSGRVLAGTSDEVGQLAAAFNQMAADLATVDQERRDLVANVSHELRTPLAALAARLENLADGVEEATPEALAEAVDQVRRLSRLVADLLDLSRLQAGVLTPTVDDVAVAELLADLVRRRREWSGESGSSGRGVRYVVQAEAGLIARADAARLEQLVTNLLDNAARHSPPGGTVRVAAGTGASGWWLEVADEGPGVAPADRERVFERFGTLAGVEGGGTGLGLAIARWVAELHGGSVGFVDPEPGRAGARVRAEFPGGLVSEPPAVAPRGSPPPARSAQHQPADQTHQAHETEEHAMPTTTIEPRPAATPQPDGGAQGSLIDQVFGRVWPARNEPNGRPGLVVGALGVGLIAALVAESWFGIGTFCLLIAAAAVIFAGARDRRDAFGVACAVLVVLLALPVMLLDAEWIAMLCILAGTALTAIAVTGVRGVPGIIAAGISWPLAAIRGLPLLGRSLARFTGGGHTPSILRTVIWSAAGLIVFGVLFASADALFANWVDRVVPDWSLDGLIGRAFFGFLVAGVTLTGAYLAVNPPPIDLELPRRPVANRYEWLVPVLIVDAVFAVFLAAQATVVFGGHDYLRRTTGLTYAEYVHQGFGQMTVATALTLLVVAVAARKVADRDRRLMQAALGLLCLLTLVVVASALYRMHVYQEAYGYTTLRLLVDVFQGWLGVVVLGVMVAGVVSWRRWLPRFAVITGVLGLLGLAAINPDAWVAEHNLERYAAGKPLDVRYLGSLSHDATPAIVAALPVRDAVCITQSRAGMNDTVWSWNLGRMRGHEARQSLGEENLDVLGRLSGADDGESYTTYETYPDGSIRLVDPEAGSPCEAVWAKYEVDPNRM